MFGHTAYCYCLAVLFVLFLLARRMVNSPFGLSLLAIKGNPLRAAAVGIPVNGRLVAIYTIAAGYAGVAGALLTQTTAFASLAVFDFDRSADLLLVLIIGGTGYLYGGLIGAIVFKLMQDYLAALTPQYWPFWIGLLLVVIVLVGRERITRLDRCRSAGCRRASTGARARLRRLRSRRCADDGARARDGRPGEALRRHRRHQQRLAEDRDRARAMR